MRNASAGNLWRASTRYQLEAPPLSANAAVDLAIVGGGFTGLSAALEAARAGATVLLLEGATFGHGGSGRNVGLVNAGLWLPPDTVVAQLGVEAGGRLVSILSEGPALVWSTIEREGIDCDATLNGTLHLAHSPRGFEDLKERYRQGTSLGAPQTLLDKTETTARTGSTAFHGALHDSRAGTVQPLSYALGLADAAMRAGARLHEQSRVTRIEREGGRWRLNVNGHEVRSEAVLVATNAYFDSIQMPFFPQMVAVSYSQFATAPMPENLRQEILPEGEGCWDTALVMSSFRADRSGRLIVGGIGNSEGPGARIHASWARRKLRQVYPQLADLPFEYSWRGRIAMTQDHIPKIVEFGPSAYACFGYSGRGIAPGTVFGTRLARALMQRAVNELPVEPVHGHGERLISLREAYYEAGAIVTHALQPFPLV